jgi:hypothetical protein
LPPGIWKVNNETEVKLRKRVKQFLKNKSWASNVRDENVRNTGGLKKKVAADMDNSIIPSTRHGISGMRVEVKYRPSMEPTHCQIQLIESGQRLIVAWHLDDTHPELGRAHVEYEQNGAKDRRPYCPNNQEGDRHALRITYDVLGSIEDGTAFNIPL